MDSGLTLDLAGDVSCSFVEAAVSTQKNSHCAHVQPRVDLVFVRAGIWISNLCSMVICGQGRGNLGIHRLLCLSHQVLVAVFGNLAPDKAAFSTNSSDADVAGC